MHEGGDDDADVDDVTVEICNAEGKEEEEEREEEEEESQNCLSSTVQKNF